MNIIKINHFNNVDGFQHNAQNHELRALSICCKWSSKIGIAFGSLPPFQLKFIWTGNTIWNWLIWPVSSYKGQSYGWIIWSTSLTPWKHNNFHCGSFFSYFQIVHSIFKINQAPALPIGLNLISFVIYRLYIWLQSVISLNWIQPLSATNGNLVVR